MPQEYAYSTDKNGKKVFLGYHSSKEIAAEAVSSFLHKEFPHLF